MLLYIKQFVQVLTFSFWSGTGLQKTNQVYRGEKFSTNWRKAIIEEEKNRNWSKGIINWMQTKLDQIQLTLNWPPSTIPVWGAFHNRICQNCDTVQGDNNKDDNYETNWPRFSDVSTNRDNYYETDWIKFSANLIRLSIGWLWRSFPHHGSQGSS